MHYNTPYHFTKVKNMKNKDNINKQESYLLEMESIFLRKPEVIFDIKFNKAHLLFKRETVTDILHNQGIVHPKFGLTHSNYLVFPDYTIEDIIIFLNEGDIESRTFFVLTELSDQKKIDETISILNTIDEGHPFIYYLSLDSQPYFERQDMQNIAESSVNILNSAYVYKYRNTFTWDEHFILSKLGDIIYSNIPDKLRTNRVLSHIVYGKECHDLFEHMDDIYSPYIDEDFPMPTFDCKDPWIETIDELIKKNSKLPKKASNSIIYKYFLQNPLQYLNRIKSDHSFCKEYYNVALGYEIIRHDPFYGLFIPKRLLTIKQYALIVRRKPELLNKIPAFLQTNKGFIELLNLKKNI